MPVDPEATKSRFICFNKGYFVLAFALLATEIVIALYVHDAYIRPYGGDFLVVIFIYCLVKSFINTAVPATALGVLVFSYLVETLQYFRFIYWLGWEKSTLARVIIGTQFTWTDIGMYTLGIALVLVVEAKRKP